MSFSRKKNILIFIFIFLTLHFPLYLYFFSEPITISLSSHTFENFDNPLYYLGAIGLGIIGICLALLGFFCTGDLFYACCRSKYNSNLLIKTIDKGNRPVTRVSSAKFLPRTEIVKRLERILQPDENQSYYYVICGEHGTGKTTVVKTASSNVHHGVVYVDIPARNENLGVAFGVAFGQALNFAFEERISFTNQLIRKLGSTSNNSDELMWCRALEAFKRGAEVYKAKRGKPAVIVYDNVNQLVHENPKILDTLQDDAKKNADDQIYIAVFVSSEGMVPRRMESRSSWSRAEPVMEIGDLSEEESMEYLTKKCSINEEVAKQLYNLVGGRILNLKFVATKFIAGQSFEDIKKEKLKETRKKFKSAKLLENQTHYEAGKHAINALLKSKEIDIDVFRKLFANEEEYDEILGANVFAYHPSRDTVGFQSKLIECYIQANSDLFVDLINLTPTNEFNSNYASTSKL
ncbi:hypothetical protein Glove_85g71 [Diversispora epigaea]|uniref:ATPase domain-containing protein n=1 Tax=Diversispora epigaea TaxID=1348612 RepID=A0A397JDQ7_9GLOM|nr:hypothetical protein Glove_85g71 [Diversispora epigaea]